MLFGRPIERRGNYFTFDRASHVGYFFRALVNQQDDQFHFGMIFFDAGCNRLHHGGLAGFWWRHDDAALAFADWRNQVNDACRHIEWFVHRRQHQLFVRKQRGEFFELFPVASLFGFTTIN